MAYVDFTADPILQQAPAVPRMEIAPATEGETRLSPLEWSVVALARNDALSSLREPGRIAMALGSLFGRRPTPTLADPRLEALRRIAVLSWHRGFSVPAGELAAFLRAGFSTGQYETLVASIGVARARG